MNVIRCISDSFNTLWQQLWQTDQLQYPLYSNLNIEYQKEYFQKTHYTDLSFVIEENGLPLLGMRLALGLDSDGMHELSGFGRPIFYLEAQNTSTAWRQRAVKVMKIEFDRIVRDYSVSSIVYRDLASILSPLGQYLLEIGATAISYFTQVIDLTVDEVLLHQQARKSYQNLINWGTKNIFLQLLDSNNIALEDMEKFRKLHVEVAGRETRSPQTWQLQYKMVRQGEAFVVLGYLNEELVTGALFNFSPKYCYYGVAASKRELFDKPLSHGVLWTAILHAKKMGCHFFETGEQLYPHQGNPYPTPKELGISTFKRGFGGQTRVQLDISWKK